MNALIAGIPIPGLIALIIERDPEVKLWVAESRPFEEAVSAAIAKLQESGTEVTVLTDNMISALLDKEEIDMVWSLYVSKGAEQAETINGGLTAALLADVRGIPFGLYPVDNLPEVEPGQFASGSILVPGAEYIEYAPDMVPLSLAKEVVEHG